MPRPKITDKFFVYNARKSGFCKNKMLIGVNHMYGGKTDNLYLQDLIDFLKEKEIDPSTVKIHGSFSGHVEK